MQNNGLSRGKETKKTTYRINKSIFFVKKQNGKRDPEIVAAVRRAKDGEPLLKQTKLCNYE